MKLLPPHSCRRRTSPRTSRDGFTLFELVVVVVIIGIMFSIAIPMLGGLTPRYRLRTYARQIAGAIDQARVNAIVRGKITGIRYNLDTNPQYFQILPPAPVEYPDQPLEERESGLRLETPPGVRIRSLLLPGSRGGVISRGVVHVAFTPVGVTGSHIVILETVDKRSGSEGVISLKYNSISGILDYYNTEVDFQHHEG